MRILAVPAVLLFVAGCGVEEVPLASHLAALPGSSVTPVDTEAPFVAAVDLRLEQPLDHDDAAAGSFNQRILVEHRGFDRPVVLVTEGQNLGDNQAAELAEIIGANQIRVEHRFTGESVPDEAAWEFLTIAQASRDVHRIVTLLREVYPGPWIGAGWGKGGQTALIFRSHFPEDVVATVVYDAPLPLALEDPRIDVHLSTVGTGECRQRLENFQRICLERRESLLPLFRWYAKGKGWGFSLGVERVFDYTVLELPFSYWQYSEVECDTLPDADASDERFVEMLVDIVDASWFSDAFLDSPSFHQFCTELGLYGYDESPFSDLLPETDYPLCAWVPGWSPEAFDPRPMQELDRWVRTNADRVMSIYGGIDPWSAPAIPVGGNDQVQLWQRTGNHLTFIRTLSEEDQLVARQALARWLGLPLEELGP
jgi:hypothetical protein